MQEQDFVTDPLVLRKFEFVCHFNITNIPTSLIDFKDKM